MNKKPLSRLTAAAAAVLALGFSPLLAAGGAPDLDGDGIPNVVDPDIDNDGIPNALDKNVDGGIARSGPHAGQYIGDHLDNSNPAEKDIDDDGLADDSLGELNIDGDAERDDSMLEADIDGDGRDDDSSAEMDVDGDGVNDDVEMEDDIDGDGFDDDDYAEADIDGDGRADDNDSDIDGDERSNGDSTEDNTDGDKLVDNDAMEENDDGDSLNDREDDDDDNDGVTDEDDGDHHAESDEQEVQVSLTRQPAAPGGSRCRVKVQQMTTGKIKFEIDGREFPAGSYDVIIDGVIVGTLPMTGSGKDTEGEQKWETGADPGEDELPLTFEVIGKPVSLSRDGVVYFNGTVPLPPPPPGGGIPATPAAGNLLAGPAAPAGAHGEVDVSFGSSGIKELEIEIEDVPAGNYDFVLGDLTRGTITVSGGKGKLRFDTNPNNSGERLLDFTASGLGFTIVQGADVFFTGTVPSAPPGVGDGDDSNDDGGAASLTVTLSRNAAPAGAKAEVSVHFGVAGATSLELEIEDAADGVYSLFIGGEEKAVFTVASGQAEVRFETTPESGELPLDFAVAGLPVSIVHGGTVFFSGSLPVAP